MKTHRAMSLAFVALVFLLVQICSSQGGFRMSTEERVQMLKDSLSLDSIQVLKITVIVKASDKERQELFDNSDGDRDAMREKMMAMMDKTDMKIKAELTKRQKAKYDGMIERRKQRMNSLRGGGQ